jgi:hypothetical protein
MLAFCHRLPHANESHGVTPACLHVAICHGPIRRRIFGYSVSACAGISVALRHTGFKVRRFALWVEPGTS